MAASFGPGRLHQSRSKSRMARSRAREAHQARDPGHPGPPGSSGFPAFLTVRYARNCQVMTLRMTSPASMARKASFTSSRWMWRDTIDADVEAAGLDQVHEAREVAPHLGRAVHAAEQRLVAVEERHRREGDGGVEARHADDDRGAAGAGDRRRPGGSSRAGRSPRTRSRCRGRRWRPAPARPGRRRPGRSRSVAPNCSAVLRFISTGSMAKMRDARRRCARPG